MTERSFRRIPKASDAIVEDLRSQILGNALPEGYRLPSENELLVHYGVSKGALREALRLVEVEGLIEVLRGRTGGIVVRHPDSVSVSRQLAAILTLRDVPLKDFIEFRRSWEPAIAAAAASRATESQVEQLMRLSELPGEVGSSGDKVSDFHVHLGYCSGNSVHSLLLDCLRPVMIGHIRTGLSDVQHNEDSRRAHMRIARAVADRDPDKARRYMELHLLALEEFLVGIEQLDAPVVPREVWANSTETLVRPDFTPSVEERPARLA